MSTIAKVNFEPVTDILPITRRDFPLADKTLADPMNAVCLIDGEWLTLDSNYKGIRAAAIATPGNLATVRSFPLWAERGRYDVRAMADVKVPTFYMGCYEADTRIFDATAALGSGAAITTPFQPLKVATIVLGTRNCVGLVGHGGSGDVSPVVGYVTRLPAANGGKLRFMSGWRS